MERIGKEKIKLIVARIVGISYHRLEYCQDCIYLYGSSGDLIAVIGYSTVGYTLVWDLYSFEGVQNLQSGIYEGSGELDLRNLIYEK